MLVVALCRILVTVAPSSAPHDVATDDLRSRDSVALHAGGWTLELEVGLMTPCLLALTPLEHTDPIVNACVPNGLTKCAQLELARDPPDYDAQDESIDISITLSHFPSHNSTEPTRLRPPVRPGTSLQGQISFGQMPAGTFTFPALAVDAAYADSDPNVGGPHHPSLMMSFINLGPCLPSSHRVTPAIISI